MRKLASAILFFASMSGAATSALAGTSDAFTFYPSISAPVAALSNPVTYATPASGTLSQLETYVGFNVGDFLGTGFLLKNTSGNTVNNVTVTFSASVTDPQEMLTLFSPGNYLPTACSWAKNADGSPTPANPALVTCTIAQMKSGDSFPAFTVFFVAPTKVAGCTNTDSTSCDTISTNVSVVYSEGSNGPVPPSPSNSNQSSATQALVTLGTANPVNVKSAVPRNGSKLFTGTGGIPTPGNKFTELGSVPPLTSSNYTKAEIVITDDSCSSSLLARCPTYATTIADPFTSAETRFLDYTKPLTTTYRIDATNFKVGATKVLSSASILYSGKHYVFSTDDPPAGPFTGDGGLWISAPVTACLVKDQPRADGLPCINSSQCYKNNYSNSDLAGDCEWVLINTGNGTLKIQ